MTKDGISAGLSPAETPAGGAWLNRRRLAAYPLIFILLYALAGFVWVVTADGLVDPRGTPLGADFLGFWSASTLTHAAGWSAPYDLARLQAAQTALLGRPVAPFLWLYPPVALMLVWPLALVGYGPAFVLWGGGQLALAWCVLRRILRHPLAFRLLLAFPATFLSLAGGQNALLSASLLGLGLLALGRYPLLAGLAFAGLCYKPHLGLMIPVALLAGGHWRAFVAAGVGVLGLAAASLGVAGLDSWQAYFAEAGFARRVLEDGGVDWGKMASVFAGLRLLGLPTAAAWSGQAASAGLAAALVARLWRRPGPAGGKAAGLAAGTLLATPFLLDYDLTILGLGLAWLAADGPPATGRRLPWLAILWCSPLMLRPLGLGLSLPTGPVAAAGLLALALGTSPMNVSGGLLWHPRSTPPGRCRRNG